MSFNNHKVIATICARGGSKGVPGKNIRLLKGRPLIQYTIECALGVKSIDKIVVSTDCDEILNVVNKLGIETNYKRPPQMALDTSAKIDAIKDIVEHTEKISGFFADIVVDLDIGVPLREPVDVENAIAKIIHDVDMESLVTVYPAERSPYFNMVEKKDNSYYSLVKLPSPPVVRRQDAPLVFSITPAVFIWKRNALGNTHLFKGKWGVYEMPIERSIDIDTEFEFRLVNFLMDEKKDIQQ
jgi:CMP-N,N'-diacetyllegionaminic acid synthase